MAPQPTQRAFHTAHVDKHLQMSVEAWDTRRRKCLRCHQLSPSWSACPNPIPIAIPTPVPISCPQFYLHTLSARSACVGVSNACTIRVSCSCFCRQSVIFNYILATPVRIAFVYSFYSYVVSFRCILVSLLGLFSAPSPCRPNNFANDVQLFAQPSFVTTQPLTPLLAAANSSTVCLLLSFFPSLLEFWLATARVARTKFVCSVNAELK